MRILLLISLLSMFSMPAQAASVKIKNCGAREMSAIVYNHNDKVYMIGSDGKTILPGQTHQLNCKGATCHVKIDGHLSKNIPSGEYHIRHDLRSTRPELVRGFSCHVSAKSTIRIVNCSTKSVHIAVFNQLDLIRTIPITQQTLTSKAQHTYFCHGEACWVKLAGKLLSEAKHGSLYLVWPNTTSTPQLIKAIRCPEPLPQPTIVNVKNCTIPPIFVFYKKFNGSEIQQKIGYNKTVQFKCLSKTCYLRGPFGTRSSVQAGNYRVYKNGATTEFGPDAPCR